MAAMPAVPIVLAEDLAPFASIEPDKAEAMITDATAMAVRVAPCIADADFANLDAARAILRGAILRWHEAGSGAITQQSAGPFQQTVDTRSGSRRGLLWPSEIAALKELCTQGGSSAFTVDPTPIPATGQGWHWVAPDQLVYDP